MVSNFPQFDYVLKPADGNQIKLYSLARFADGKITVDRIVLDSVCPDKGLITKMNSVSEFEADGVLTWTRQILPTLSRVEGLGYVDYDKGLEAISYCRVHLNNK